MKITYTDFVTHKKRFTRLPFVGWVRGGILNVPGAVFQGRNSSTWIPIYLLSKESMALLPPVLLTPKEG